MKERRQTEPCIDCGTPIRKRDKPHRCRKCYMSFRQVTPKQYCCRDCGTFISRKATRCRHCAGVRNTPVKKKCPDCGKPIERSTTRCWRCYSLARPRDKQINRCKDCNKIISNKALRCVSCFNRHQTKYKGNLCPDCGKSITRYSTRCRSCHTKKQWQDGILNSPEIRAKVSDGLRRARLRGAYDGVFQSPTSLELKVSAALDLLGLNHIPQYRPRNCKFSYDEYLPNLNMLIEADGEYWHSLPKARARDKQKTQWANKNGYGLLRLPESDIIEGGAWVTLAKRLY